MVHELKRRWSVGKRVGKLGVTVIILKFRRSPDGEVADSQGSRGRKEMESCSCSQDEEEEDSISRKRKLLVQMEQCG